MQLDSVGEVLLEVGASAVWGRCIDNEEKLDSSIERMKTAATTHSADLTVLRKRVVEAAGHEDQGVVQCHIADVLIRQTSGLRQPLEVSDISICLICRSIAVP